MTSESATTTGERPSTTMRIWALASGPICGARAPRRNFERWGMRYQGCRRSHKTLLKLSIFGEKYSNYDMHLQSSCNLFYICLLRTLNCRVPGRHTSYVDKLLRRLFHSFPRGPANRRTSGRASSLSLVAERRFQNESNDTSLLAACHCWKPRYNAPKPIIRALRSLITPDGRNMKTASNEFRMNRRVRGEIPAILGPK